MFALPRNKQTQHKLRVFTLSSLVCSRPIMLVRHICSQCVCRTNKQGPARAQTWFRYIAISPLPHHHRANMQTRPGSPFPLPGSWPNQFTSISWPRDARCMNPAMHVLMGTSHPDLPELDLIQSFLSLLLLATGLAAHRSEVLVFPVLNRATMVRPRPTMRTHRRPTICCRFSIFPTRKRRATRPSASTAMKVSVRLGWMCSTHSH